MEERSTEFREGVRLSSSTNVSDKDSLVAQVERENTAVAASSSSTSSATASPAFSVHAESPQPQEPHPPSVKSSGTHPSPALQADVAVTVGSEDIQRLSDLKGELLYATRSLTLTRQQARTAADASADLRQRCHALEAEKQALSLELMETRDRLQSRHVRLEELRREAAEAKLRVLSLTAERDALTAKVQEAWDRVADLSEAVRCQESEKHQLQTALNSAQNESVVTAQQRVNVEQHLCAAQEQLQERAAAAETNCASLQRLLLSLQDAVQRLAELLSNVAYDYQQSLDFDGEELESANALPPRITAPPHSDADVGAAGDGPVADAPRVMLSSAHQPDASTPNGQGPRMQPHVLSSFPRQQHVPSRKHPAPEASRLLAEHVLLDAEAVVLRSTKGDAKMSAPASSTRQRGDDNNVEDASVDTAADCPTGGSLLAKASPSRLSTSAESPCHSTTPDRLSVDATVFPKKPWLVPREEQASLRAAVSPLLLAFKQLAATLSSARRERQRWVSEAVHFQCRAQEARQQLKSFRQSQTAEEVETTALHGRLGALQQHTEQMESTLQECQREDQRRRGGLARALHCTDDWSLIQHSLELLLVQHAELQKDLDQQQQQQQRQSTSNEEVRVRGYEAKEKTPGFLHDDAVAVEASNSPPEPSRHFFREPTVEAEETLERCQPTGAPPSKTTLRVHELETHGTTPPTECASPPPLTSNGATTTPPKATITTSVTPPVENGSRSPSAWLHRSPVPTVALHQEHVTEGVRVGAFNDAHMDAAPHHMYADYPNINGALSASPQGGHPQRSSSSAFSQALRETRSAEHSSKLSAGPSIAANTPNVPVSLPAQHWKSPSTAYPAPHDTAATLSSYHGTAHAVERELMTSLHRQSDRLWPTSPLRDAVPLPTAPLANGASALVDSPVPRDRLPSGMENEGSGVDYSALFAAEVLQVIEALDRRVAGALHRSPPA